MKSITKFIAALGILTVSFACTRDIGTENNNAYQIVDSWMDNDTLIKTVTLVEKDGSLHIDILRRDGSGRFLNVTKNGVNGKTRFDFENDNGEYFIIEKNGDFAFYDSIGKTREIKIYNHQ